MSIIKNPPNAPMVIKYNYNLRDIKSHHDIKKPPLGRRQPTGARGSKEENHI